MAKYVGYKRPKDTKKTVKHLLLYLGHYKWAFLLIAILVFISAGAGIMGTFLIKPVVLCRAILKALLWLCVEWV